MRKKITFLFLSLTMALLNVSAQYTTDGVYTLKYNPTNRYMTVNTTSETDVKMTGDNATPDDYAKFAIVKNVANSTESVSKYNIISKDNLLFSNDASKSILVDNISANKGSEAALLTITTSTNGVIIEFNDLLSTTPGIKTIHGRRTTNSDVGFIAYNATYEWILTRTGDLPAADLTAPTTPTNFGANLGTKELSWSEGTDAVGVKKTYILRATNTSADAPVLTQQEVYAVNAIIGDWAVIAIVNGGTATYTDATAATGTDYKYAIAHRDMAYNNSTALVSATVNYTATGLNNTSVANLTYVATSNGIEFRSLKQGEEISIYNMTGAKVFGQNIDNANLSVGLAKGIYMVRLADKVAKVIVK